MLVAYNKPNVFTVHLASDGDTVVNGTKPFQFIPGINDIPKDKWLKLAEHPSIVRAMDEDRIEILFEGESEDGKAAITAVKDVKKAVKIVKRVYDLHLLKVWEKGEHRQEVISACMSQIDQIMTDTHKPKTGTDD